MRWKAVPVGETPTTDPPEPPAVIVAQGHVLTYGTNGNGVTAYDLPDLPD